MISILKNYTVRLNRIPLFLFIILAILSSCKKKESVTEEAPTLMTLQFTGNYIYPQLSAIIFISDDQGKVIGDTMVSGNTTVAIKALSGKTVPASFTVTLATWEPGMHNFVITLNTYTNVSPGTWALEGHRADTTGHYTLSFQNVPQTGSPILFSNKGYSNETFITEGLTGYLYGDPDDLYIKINTNAGPKFKWVPGIQPSAMLVVDLSQMEDASLGAVNLPFSAQQYVAKLKGYPGSDHTTPFWYLSDDVISDGTPKSQLLFAYPPGKFDGFGTSIEIAENYITPYIYTYHLDGPIPESFRKIDAQVNSVTVNAPGAVTQSLGGTYTSAETSWFFNAYNHQAFIWNIYCPQNTGTVKLPDLSPDMKRMFPSLAHDSLTYSQTELYLYYAAADYPSWVRMLFDPSAPKQAEHLEASSIRYLPGK
jgi:hypothetical protein